MILDRFRLDDKVAVVTGAGRGIGAASAVALAEVGADVVISARTESQLDEVAARIEAAGRTAAIVTADLADLDSVANLAEVARERFGRLDVVVNNVGGTIPNVFMDTTDDYLDEAFHWNVTTAHALTRAAVPLMLEHGGGSVVNISSVMGRVSGRGYLAYGTAKAALSHYTRLAARDLAPRIRVNAIGVGSVATSALEFVLHDEATRDVMESSTPLQRIGDPDDIAATVVYLASAAGAYVTGKVIEADGGQAEQQANRARICEAGPADYRRAQRVGVLMLRVVQWSTGHVGRHALIGIDAHPELELVGVWVSSDAKAGRDAGELAGLGRSLGVAATTDADALLALRPDCIVHTAMADHRLGEAIEDLCGFLRAGIDVVSSGPVFLQYPDGVMPDEMIAPIRDAAAEGGASLWVNGIDPGFANDWLALTLTSISERIEEVRCMEILNYATYDQAMVLNDIMGFGKPLDEVPFILLPGILTTAWGSVVRQLAAGLGVELDEIEEHYERVPAPETFEIPTGTIAEGTQAALRFEVRGKVGDRTPIVLEHVTRLRDDLAPDWPQPTGHGGYRVIVTGEPMYTLDLQMLGTDGDHNTAGLKATAMRLVNAVPAVVAAPPGLLTALDLPLITGRGLVR